MANLRANKIVGIGSTDAGVTFDGPISLNTQGYMYFPTGVTSERGRGRQILRHSNETDTTKNVCMRSVLLSLMTSRWMGQKRLS